MGILGFGYVSRVPPQSTRVVLAFYDMVSPPDLGKTHLMILIDVRVTQESPLLLPSVLFDLRPNILPVTNSDPVLNLRPHRQSLLSLLRDIRRPGAY